MSLSCSALPYRWGLSGWTWWRTAPCSMLRTGTLAMQTSPSPICRPIGPSPLLHSGFRTQWGIRLRRAVLLNHDMYPQSRESLAPPAHVIDSMKYWYYWVCMKGERLFPLQEGELVVTTDFRNVIVVHLAGAYANFFAAHPIEMCLPLGQIAEYRILSFAMSSSRLRFLSVLPHKRRQGNALEERTHIIQRVRGFYQLE